MPLQRMRFGRRGWSGRAASTAVWMMLSTPLTSSSSSCGEELCSRSLARWRRSSHLISLSLRRRCHVLALALWCQRYLLRLSLGLRCRCHVPRPLGWTQCRAASVVWLVSLVWWPCRARCRGITSTDAAGGLRRVLSSCWQCNCLQRFMISQGCMVLSARKIPCLVLILSRSWSCYI